MERVSKLKLLPRELPAVSSVSNQHIVFEGGGLMLNFQAVHCRDKVGRRNAENSQLSESAEPVRTWNGDPLEERVLISFSGASHPPEPVGMDPMGTVYVPISQKKSDPGCLIKSMLLKGPFLDDLSIRVPHKKPSPAVLSPAESLVEEPNDLGTLSSSPFPGPSASKNADDSLIHPGSNERECVLDALSLPGDNVSPHSSIDSTGIATAMSIVNSSVSTCRSDAVTSYGMERNCDSTEGSVRVDSLESAKTSVSQASDSSLSDDSNWSNITGSANKPRKGNDPRWNAILAIWARDGILGMSHFRLFKRLGRGDIGSVYLSELSGTSCNFAMKVMDKASLASHKKLNRALTEREILQLLDHPFLPTLYTHFETNRMNWSLELFIARSLLRLNVMGMEMDSFYIPNLLSYLNSVEPTAARSMSFVGTHEYLAPEIIKGEGHGNAVDWRTFGIFLHELLYGKTPFKGSGNRATLFNVVGQQLKFPDSPTTSYVSCDLIRGLLVKEPQHRLGVKRGATDIKQHPFFEGVN
ncbi:hypothetical protein F3Y22_tig00112738pilonHSYRG01310 [Hibiscus syriacus]|uniref:non-specific serine/threonine protein kinase n=1 Tax=Hibiscus syriacus TaxID=106335 RepID=A0A6A2Y0L5_HIBSY|nr:hypothetical protein F3Y22_tig00112738pilonHSYRG01310 [Hibiscus syriacus]